MTHHLRRGDFFVGHRNFAPRVRIQCAVFVVLHGNTNQSIFADAVVVHVALNLHAEELRRQRHADVAVPFAEAAFGVHGKRAARVFVETHRHADVEHARLDCHERRLQRAAAGRAAVGDVDELKARQPELRHHRVGGAGRGAAAVCEFHVGPLEAGVFQCLARGVYALIESADAISASERVNADADDCDVYHVRAP